MNFDRKFSDGDENIASIWRFAECELDELSRQLRVKGAVVELESKPFDVLLQLLLRAGEVVTKEELLESVWPEVIVVDSSLATAVSKLRKALGDEDPPIIVTLPRVGYRLAVPVHRKAVPASARTNHGLKPGDSIPGRDHWLLIRPLDKSISHEVWLAKHGKTGETRVFKFAWDGVHLTALKREVTLYRYLREALGNRPDFVRVLEWNFDTLPFFVESEYSGIDLLKWSDEQGGLLQIPREERLRLIIRIAQSIAAAHDVGVLHKDLKPANILISRRTDSNSGSSWQTQITDFGSAFMLEPTRLAALGITNLGFSTIEKAEGTQLGGTLMYLAPEVLAGHSSTASADVYSLGVMLYQAVAGDFRMPLSPGWESNIDDALLREDIALAACGDPAGRLPSVADLATRLLTLDQRRVKRNELELAKQRALAAERKLTESRARRPWIAAAAVVLAMGLVISTGLYLRASRDRDHANRQTAIATAADQFLTNDLLGRSNPFQSGTAGESFIEAVKQASPSIDLQFKNEPQVAAHLHQTVARALDNRTDYVDARKEYDRAAALYQQAEGESSQDAIVVRLQRAAMEARTYGKDSIPNAKAILAEQETIITKLEKPRADLSVWLSTAKGMIALVENKADTAVANFKSALDKARTLSTFDESARLTLEQRLAFAYIRLGDGSKAESLLRQLIASFTEISGPESPSVLRVRLNLAQAFMIQNKHREAVYETTLIYPEFVKRLGKDNELTMQVLTTRAQSEGSLGIWNDAVRDDLAIYDIAMHKQGPLSFYAIATLSDAALAQCRSGAWKPGEANARKAFEASQKAFGDRAGLTHAAAYTLASCVYGLDRLEEASNLVRNIDIPTVSQLAGIPDWGANVYLLQAQIAYRKRDLPSAREYLAKSKPTFLRADAEMYQKNAVQVLSEALNKPEHD